MPERGEHWEQGPKQSIQYQLRSPMPERGEPWEQGPKHSIQYQLRSPMPERGEPWEQGPKHSIQNQLRSPRPESKGLSRASKISSGHLGLREENLSFNNNYMYVI